jgi:AbrB family looped-hinge helix DNA binding protein
MEIAKVTSKGQITIPKEVREQLGLRPGDQIEFVRENGHFRVQKVSGRAPFSRWRGYLKHMKGVDVDAYVEELRGR